MSRSISIVIPAYNEEQRLPATLGQVARFLEGMSPSFSEIIVVDDGSRDGTAGIAAKFGSPVRLLQNPGNRGKGYSVRHGMLDARGDWVLFSDADLSAPIGELPKLFDAAEQHQAAIAIGSRAIDRSLIGTHQSAFRENAGRFFNLVMRLSTGLPYHDTQCGFKLFRREVAHAIFSRQQLERFGFDVEILFIAHLLGYPAIEVPVRWNHVEGSKVGMFSGLDGFVDIGRVRWNQLQGKYR